MLTDQVFHPSSILPSIAAEQVRRSGLSMLAPFGPDDSPDPRCVTQPAADNILIVRRTETRRLPQRGVLVGCSFLAAASWVAGELLRVKMGHDSSQKR